MKRSRLMVVATVLIIAAIIAAGWILGIDPKLKEAARADADRSIVEATNTAQEATLRKLKKLYDDLPNLQLQLADIQKSIPTDAAIADFIGQLNVLADASGVEITAFVADAPADFIPVDDGSTPAPGTETPTTETPDTAKTSPAPTETTPTSSGLVSIPVSVEVNGSAEAVVDFIKRAQFGDRLFLVTDLKVTMNGGGSTTTIRGLVYVLPNKVTSTEAEGAPSK